MDQNGVIKGDYYSSSRVQQSSRDKEEIMEVEEELRRGPWTVEEDFTLINYIAHHGEGRWNSLARCAGLKRTGKSCRLRWLNYLRPDVRRGNITLEEQLMILELHSRWGNRWSKIAQHLPGRTDNEIKNYWRTRVQKHAKQLKCDVNSKQFKDTMRYLWMPRLVERIQAAAAAANSNNGSDEANFSNTSTAATSSTYNYNTMSISTVGSSHHHQFMMMQQLPPPSQENSSTAAAASSTTTTTTTDSFGTPVSDLTDCYNYSNNNNNNNNSGIVPVAVHHVSHPNNNNHQEYSTAATNNNNYYPTTAGAGGNGETTLTSPTGNYYFNYQQQSDFQEYMIMEQQNNNYNKREYWEEENDDVSDCLWNVEDVWFLHQQLANSI